MAEAIFSFITMNNERLWSNNNYLLQHRALRALLTHLAPVERPNDKLHGAQWARRRQMAHR